MAKELHDRAGDAKAHRDNQGAGRDRPKEPHRHQWQQHVDDCQNDVEHADTIPIPHSARFTLGPNVAAIRTIPSTAGDAVLAVRFGAH